ncbi:MAG: hypothetical protein WEE89_10630 [Gemmatimonadota bacterium]
MSDVWRSDEGSSLVVLRSSDVVPRPDPRQLRFGRVRIAVIRTFGVALALAFFGIAIWRFTEGDWAGIGALVFGTLMAIGAIAVTPDLGTGENVRVRCPVCDLPTFLLEEDTLHDLRDDNRADENVSIAILPRGSCPLCEWQLGRRRQKDPRPDLGLYDPDGIAQARANFATHLRYYSPDDVPGWVGGATSPDEAARKQRFMELCDQLDQLPDGEERFKVWKAVTRSARRMERDTALRLSRRAALVYDAKTVIGWLRKLLPIAT